MLKEPIREKERESEALLLLPEGRAHAWREPLSMDSYHPSSSPTYGLPTPEPHATANYSTNDYTNGPSSNSNNGGSGDAFTWTAVTVVQSMALFLAAGVAEIGGGWLVWQTMRASKPWWWAALGSLVLVSYGFLPTLQPSADEGFGRIYAVYGGFFIVLSFLWGWLLDGDRPDWGDVVGGAISLAGVLLILFWPR
jgi:small multidrug resistance family-3 protein